MIFTLISKVSDQKIINQIVQNQNQFQNTFNQGNSQFGANFQQGADMFNTNAQLQNQGMINQFGLGSANVGLGMQQNQMQAQQGAIQAFMQMLMQNQGLNTAQAQTYNKPGYIEQGLGILGTGANIASKFMNPFGGMMGGGSNTMMAPQVMSTPQYNPYGSMGYGGGGFQMANINPQIPQLPMPIPMPVR